MLPKLDSSAPYCRRVFLGGLGFHAEKIAEKSPMWFNSEESFTEMDENGDMADRIGVEVLQLNSIEVEKTTEEGASGEGESPFRERAERNDLIDVFHGKWIAKRKTPIDEIPFLKQTPQYQIC
jgi:hypothetical protein